ncbi:hypothetical protein [Spirillospora sp. CA-294931]|uniref:hypothetical protein n=1 Tax=Spirillospora sp. CA-294931 TaxID=3240042 RepID=UPI003D8D5C1C
MVKSILIALTAYLLGSVVTGLTMLQVEGEIDGTRDTVLWSAVPAFLICLVAALAGTLTGRGRLRDTALPPLLVLAAFALTAVSGQPLLGTAAAIVAGAAGAAPGRWLASRLRSTRGEDGYF